MISPAITQRLYPWRQRSGAWYDARSERERILLLAGTATLVIALFLVLVWVPLMAARGNARADMAAHDRAIAVLAAAGPALAAGPAQAGAPLETALTDSAARAGLDITRLEPAGDGSGSSAEITLDSAAFDDLILWIDMLGRDYAIRVQEISMERLPAPGTVSARIRFGR